LHRCDPIRPVLNMELLQFCYSVSGEREILAARVEEPCLCQQFSIRVLAPNRLPRVSPLGNMMGNVNHNDASESAHAQKISEMTRFAITFAHIYGSGSVAFPHWARKLANVPSVPAFPAAFMKFWSEVNRVAHLSVRSNSV
jgi:hypothetical protein